MDKSQKKVLEFMKAMSQEVGDFTKPTLFNTKFRVDLIEEEFNELKEAIDQNDLIGVIDALADLRYVLDGAANTWGIDLEPFFDEVHRSNMTKIGGPVREDGKRLKPPTYSPPNLEKVLTVVTHIKSLNKTELGLLSDYMNDEYYNKVETPPKKKDPILDD